MSQMTEPMGPLGPIGGPVGPMGGPVGPMGPMGGPVGPMGPMGGGSMGPMGDPMTAPMGSGPMGSGPMGEQQTGEAAGPGPAEPIVLRSMARVDLLPLEIVQNRKFARVRRGVIALVALAVLLAVAGVVWAQSGVTEAQQKVDAAQAAQQAAATSQTQYATLPQVEAQLEAARTARLTAMSQDVLFYRLLNDVKNSLPAGVTLETISTALSSAGAASASTADATTAGTTGGALTPTGIGTIQLAGTAGSYSQLAGWLNSAGQVTGVTGVALTSASETDTGTAGKVVSFNATAVLTSAALSNRYTKEG